MKLGAREARAFLRRPDPGVAGVLVTGEDGARVAEARAALVLALVGPEGDAEMRLHRIAGGDLRRDGTLLLDAVKAQGFFPGARAVLLEDATDGLAPVVAAALDAWAPGDARIVATAGSSRGALRKLFEGRAGAVAIVLYDDPPGEAEVGAMLAEAGLGAVTPDARAELLARAGTLGPGEFRQLLERLALHQMDAAEPLGPDVVTALAPAEGGDLDDLVLAVSEGRRDEAAALLQRLAARGVGPVEVAIRLGRHARTVLAVASDPAGASAGLAALRPPLGGARRQAVARAAALWRRDGAEAALRALVDLDLALRSSTAAPAHALLERTILRLARAGPRAED